MLEHKKIRELNDFFVDLEKRKNREVYFYRINGYSESIGEFIKKYYNCARTSGVVIEGKIPNPDEDNLAYYTEMMGTQFQLSLPFISNSLKKWLPRMSDFQRQMVASSLYDSLENMTRAGKTENMIKNAYVKFMCWLYYKFERVVSQLGENNIPKILYEGNISKYELMLISILSNAGCDVILLQYGGDEEYLKLDSQSVFSENLMLDSMTDFPQGYGIQMIREEIQNDINKERLYGVRPQVRNCTNAWIQGRWLADICQPAAARGSDASFFYNCFYRVNGVEDKLIYTEELLRMYQELNVNKRRIVVVSGTLSKPINEEISAIKRSNFTRFDQMILGLADNIKYPTNVELQRIMHSAFVDVMLREKKKSPENLNRLLNKAVYILCWLKRYEKELFGNWKQPDISCFIYMGGCQNEAEAFFMSFLARLPVDVLILCPNRNVRCCLDDELLYELNYPDSMTLESFPSEKNQVKMGTAAYHAERELDTLMYQDSGMYRNQQYQKANGINLQTMYEEIKILWNEELKYRPGFTTTDGIVNIPVIFSKISGVKDEYEMLYWSSIKELITEDTLLIKSVPYISSTEPNPMKAYALEFYKNGKLLRNKIKEHPKYPYGILQEERQEFILDKLQLMIESRRIKGIGENGTEYTVIAQVLNLPKDIVRMIQKFDFTKKNPKVIFVNTTENVISLEDSIIASFLNLMCFDVLFFVPTGYQSIEKYFNEKIMEEHQIGNYKYDMQMPNLTMIPLNKTRHFWRDKIFKRGN